MMHYQQLVVLVLCRRFGAALSLAMMLSTVALAAPESLETIKHRSGINADKDQVSISGLSAGGYMAVQYHISYSSQIMGVGVIAGGPYHCAGSSSLMCTYSPMYALMDGGVCRAMHVCTRMAAKSLWWDPFYFGPPDYRYSLDSTRREAQRGTIDALSGLKNDRVWIFTGARDSMVPSEIVAQLRNYYQALFALPEVGNRAEDITFIDRVPVEHSIVLDKDEVTHKDDCDRFGPPFIDHCSYAAAESLLRFIYPGREVVSASSDGGELADFDQGFVSRDQESSLYSRGHVYIPESCRNGTRCPLHIALHGCGQDEQTIQREVHAGQLADTEERYFFKDGGYNKWSGQHGVIVLYPQVASSAKNPFGCWDWWGYSGADYYFKTGKQISAIHTMVSCLTGEGDCPR